MLGPRKKAVVRVVGFIFLRIALLCLLIFGGDIAHKSLYFSRKDRDEGWRNAIDLKQRKSIYMQTILEFYLKKRDVIECILHF